MLSPNGQERSYQQLPLLKPEALPLFSEHIEDLVFLYIRKMEGSTKLADARFFTNLNMWKLQPDLISFNEVKHLIVFVSKYYRITNMC